MVNVRVVRSADRSGWDALWIGYHGHGPFGGPPPASTITESTWRRFVTPDDPMDALVAEMDGRLVGLIHMVFHPVTSLAGPVCFLNDLFVADEARGRGIGRTLVEALYAHATAKGAERVYWHMQVANEMAMKLYDRVAAPSGHTVYRKQL